MFLCALRGKDLETIMPRHLLLLLATLTLAFRSFAAQPGETKPEVKPEPVYGTLESTLPTDDKQIRMFALDGDPNSYYASKTNATANDTFTLVLDKPVALKTVSVATGRVKGTDLLDKGTLQISEDNKTFVDLAKFGADGKASGDAKGKKVLAIRLKPSEDLNHPLAVQEFTIDSDPPVATFKHPVEVFTSTEDPEMKEWIESTARVCERQYQMICEELKSDGFNPKTVVTMALTNSYKGVAATGNAKITGSVDYFKKHMKDVGAMVHEMVHVGQSYGYGSRRGGKPNPVWLVEGIADYLRCYKYEGGKLRPVPATAKYDGSYQISAHFIHFVAEKYDKDLVMKLNAACREGKYSADTWKELTKKDLDELSNEWKESRGIKPEPKPEAEKKPESDKKPDAEKKPTT